MLREIGGRYQLQKKLGAGAWATVYEALDTGAIERRVAIKVFRLPPPDEGSAAAEEHARFRQGARAAGRLSHPNIVSVFDYGEDSETAWIVMEMVEGETLKALLDRTGRLPAPEIVRLMGQILGALAYTHSRGVVHRDIKPANIMLTQDRMVKIADFGVARIENSSMTHVGTVLGSPAYMAPEQFRGDETDHRADIWAAGVILYQMLTGERPFEGVMTSVMQKALYVEPVLPSLTKAAVPPQFDAVVSKALAKRPEDRFSSAEEFSQAIRAAASAAERADPPGRDPYHHPPREDATMVSPRSSARTEGERARATSTARRSPPAARPSAGRRAQNRRPWVVAAVAGGAVLAAGAAGVLFLAPAAKGPGTTGAPASQVAEAAAGARGSAAPPQAAPAPRVEATGPSEARPSAAEAPPARPPQAATSPTPRLADPLPPPAPPPPEAQREQTALLAIPAPAPEPASPQGASRRSGLPRPDFDAAANAAASAINCGVVVPAVDESGVSLTGVARQGETAAAEAVFAALGVPASAVRLRVETFDGPYCEVLSRVRPLASANGAPKVTLESPDPLPGGQVLRFRVQMPDWPAHLHVAYLMTTGAAGNIVNAPTRHPAGSSLALTDPRWVVGEPYGTELLLVVASERPLFGPQGRRRVVEKLDQFAAELGPALSAAQDRGGRVAAQVVPVRTVMPR